MDYIYTSVSPWSFTVYSVSFSHFLPLPYPISVSLLSIASFFIYFLLTLVVFLSSYLFSLIRVVEYVVDLQHESIIT